MLKNVANVVVMNLGTARRAMRFYSAKCKINSILIFK